MLQPLCDRLVLPPVRVQFGLGDVPEKERDEVGELFHAEISGDTLEGGGLVPGQPEAQTGIERGGRGHGGKRSAVLVNY